MLFLNTPFGNFGNIAGQLSALNVADVFSTDLYTGNGSTQSITNGIDLAGEGGLVWGKNRNDTFGSFLVDSSRGIDKRLVTELTNAEVTEANGITAFNVDGFSLGNATVPNFNTFTYVAWTFRRAPKFFDVVTYTGDGNTSTFVPHSLGIKPGFIAVKDINNSSNWIAWARVSDTEVIRYNTTTQTFGFNNTSPGISATISSTVDAANDTGFSPSRLVGENNSVINAIGNNYVAYLFAHDPSDSGIIQCGSYTGNGSLSGPTVTLGWEPQWLLVKNATALGAWNIMDNVRGVISSTDKVIWANDSAIEQTRDWVDFNSTGFEITGAEANYSNINDSGETFIYMAIKAEEA